MTISRFIKQPKHYAAGCFESFLRYVNEVLQHRIVHVFQVLLDKRGIKAPRVTKVLLVLWAPLDRRDLQGHLVYKGHKVSISCMAT